MNPNVTIIVPVYNTGLRLRRCLDSITNQSLQKTEIVLVDDGSSDQSGVICDTYATVDNRVRVIHKENGGDCSARNVGLSVAQGKYVGFVDSDDYVEPDMFEIMYEIATSTNVDIVNCGHFSETPVGVEKRTTRFRKNMLLTHLDFIASVHSLQNDLEDYFFLWCNIYRRELLQDHAIVFDTGLKYGGDTHFNIRVFSLAKSFYSTDRPLYHYVRNEYGITCSRYKERYLEHLSQTYLKRVELCESIGLDSVKYMDGLRTTVIEKFLVMLLLNAWGSRDSDFMALSRAIRESKMVSEAFMCYKPTGKLSAAMQVVVYLIMHRMYALVRVLLAVRLFRSDWLRSMQKGS